MFVSNETLTLAAQSIVNCDIDRQLLYVLYGLIVIRIFSGRYSLLVCPTFGKEEIILIP